MPQSTTDPQAHKDLLAALERAQNLEAAGRPEEALHWLELTCLAVPKNADALNAKGALLGRLGRYNEAVECFELAISSRPDAPELHYNLGFALQSAEKFDLAIKEYERALSLRPAYPQALNNKGLSLHGMGKFGEALEAYDQALILEPRYARALNNRGSALTELRRLPEAIENFDRALQLEPLQVIAIHNRACAFGELGRFDEALRGFERAIAVQPSYRGAYVSLGLTQLLLGDFRSGLANYERRIGGSMAPEQRQLAAKPLEHLDVPIQKTVFVHAEQGLGDTIQFCRYATLLAHRGFRVVLEVPRELKKLLSSLAGVDRILAQDEQSPETDYHVPLLSLPFLFGTEVPTVPREVPYLTSDKSRVSKWRALLRADSTDVRPLIGVAWRGKALPGHSDQGRFFPPRQLARIADAAGARLVSLQKDASEEELICADVQRLGDDFDSGPDAFLDTAAVMASLDLTITIDNSLAHLAGALGYPVWIALKQVPDWRWMLDRSDSPWYPGARLFRQSVFDRWDEVAEEMAHALRNRPWIP